MSYAVNVRVIALSLVACFDSDRFRVLLPSRRNNICTTSFRMPLAISHNVASLNCLFSSFCGTYGVTSDADFHDYINCMKDYANRSR